MREYYCYYNQQYDIWVAGHQIILYHNGRYPWVRYYIKGVGYALEVPLNECSPPIVAKSGAQAVRAMQLMESICR